MSIAGGGGGSFPAAAAAAAVAAADDLALLAATCSLPERHGMHGLDSVAPSFTTCCVASMQRPRISACQLSPKTADQQVGCRQPAGFCPGSLAATTMPQHTTCNSSVDVIDCIESDASRPPRRCQVMF